MANELAARAYRTEVAGLRRDVARAVDAVRHHLDDARAWLDHPDGPGLQALNLGATVAELVGKAAALKALLDAAYLVDGA